MQHALPPIIIIRKIEHYVCQYDVRIKKTYLFEHALTLALFILFLLQW